MANIDLYFPKLLKYEGGFVNDPLDNGGATNKGVTIAVYKKMGYDNDKDGDIDVADLKLMSDEQGKEICKKLFWDKWQADKIISQSVAESLVEWVWGSGSYGIKIPQDLLGLVSDGVVGNRTLTAVNAQDQKTFHEQLRQRKLKFIDNIIKNNPSQKRFEKGWKRRINEFVFIS